MVAVPPFQHSPMLGQRASWQTVAKFSSLNRSFKWWKRSPAGAWTFNQRGFGDKVFRFLLTGDLAFLHDTNALLSAKDFKGSLTVILINNNGGGIFEHLQFSSREGFEEFFATPQHVDIQKLCVAYSVRYKRILNWESFTEQLNEKINGLRVLELKTDRKFDSKFLKEF